MSFASVDLDPVGAARRQSLRPHKPPQEMENPIDVAMLMNVRIRLIQAQKHLTQGSRRQASASVAAARNMLKRRMSSHIAYPIIRGGLSVGQQDEVTRFIEGNLESVLTLPELAAVLGLSVGHFCRAFHRTFGVPPKAYVRAQRIARCKALLARGREPLATIALECGFSDQSALCKAFKRLSGTSPGAWTDSGSQ